MVEMDRSLRSSDLAAAYASSTSQVTPQASVARLSCAQRCVAHDNRSGRVCYSLHYLRFIVCSSRRPIRRSATAATSGRSYAGNWTSKPWQRYSNRMILSHYERAGVRIWQTRQRSRSEGTVGSLRSGSPLPKTNKLDSQSHLPSRCGK